MQIEINGKVQRGRRRSDRDLGTAGAVSLGADADVVCPGGTLSNRYEPSSPARTSRRNSSITTRAPDSGCVFSDCVMTPVSVVPPPCGKADWTANNQRTGTRHTERITRILISQMRVRQCQATCDCPGYAGGVISLRWKCGVDQTSGGAREGRASRDVVRTKPSNSPLRMIRTGAAAIS